MRAARSDETPIVSVLMFVYNQSAYLEKSIQSVIGQVGDFPAEVIIHDDASTDGSRAIIQSYAERYPGIIISILQEENQMHQGIDFVKQFVMPRVRGKYLAYCEGDDYWIEPRKLLIQIKILERHPEFSAVCHNCKVVDADDNEIKPVRKFYPFKKNTVYTLNELAYEGRMPGQTASVVMRASNMNDLPDETRNQFRAIRHCVGDRKRTLLILLSGNALCLKRAMSAYRYVTEGGTSWNARTKGKNLSGRYFVQEYDFRTFAEKYFDRELHNDYVLFGTGLMAFWRAAVNPSDDNLAQYKLVLDTLGGRKELALFLVSCFPRALLTIPRRMIQELKWGI